MTTATAFLAAATKYVLAYTGFVTAYTLLLKVLRKNDNDDKS